MWKKKRKKRSPDLLGTLGVLRSSDGTLVDGVLNFETYDRSSRRQIDSGQSFNLFPTPVEKKTNIIFERVSSRGVSDILKVLYSAHLKIGANSYENVIEPERDLSIIIAKNASSPVVFFGIKTK